MIAQLLFVLLLAVGGFLAMRRVKFIRRNISLGRNFTPEGTPSERMKTMLLVALGQGKMFQRPVAALLHLFVYAGFVIINIEVMEILIDGLAGTHRVFAFAGGIYNFLIASFEVLALLVLLACVAFIVRRVGLNIRRFRMRELVGWPQRDAMIILVTEILLMSAFLFMNAADALLQGQNPHYIEAGSFPVSQFFQPMIQSLQFDSLVLLERFCWWFHIVGIMAFIVYLSYSKHLHIILAFPNTYYSKRRPAGDIGNNALVTREVKLMLDPSAQVDSAPEGTVRFGVKDVFDMDRRQLMSAYSCTECGRCSAECPANITGKLLSPRKIMMDTRDRLEEVGSKMDAAGGEWKDDGKSLLRDYITEEELWACTTCNACTQACPVNINPMEIIIDLRRYLIMEESKSPESITAMFNNTENNGAPWAMSAADRANWTSN
ncbi:MAG: 4Fe-4S dicluster domain-containing protein [Flavobacteriales bacterium]